MQLLYVIGTYPLVTTTFIEREISALRALGLGVQIISVRRPPPTHPAAREEILYLLPPVWLHLLAAHLYFAARRPRAFFGLLWWLLTRPHANFAQRFKTLLHFGEGVYAAFRVRHSSFEHIHAHFIDRAALIALCLSRLLNKPYSVTAHANDIFAAPTLVTEKLAPARFVITVSEFNKQHLLQTYPALEARQIHVLHPWVDTDEFMPPTARPQNGYLQIISVGRLVAKKGHAVLLDACAQLAQAGAAFECCIIGEGPLRAELQTRIAAHNLDARVMLLGAKPKVEVQAALARADVFVLAATIAPDGDRDGMPVALAEAMAMALPVISTEVVGIHEMVRDGAGFLVPPDDAAALARALVQVQQTPRAARLEMGLRARQIIADDFQVKRGVSELATLFRASSGAPDAQAQRGLFYHPRRRSKPNPLR